MFLSRQKSIQHSKRVLKPFASSTITHSHRQSVRDWLCLWEIWAANQGTHLCALPSKSFNQTPNHPSKQLRRQHRQPSTPTISGQQHQFDYDAIILLEVRNLPTRHKPQAGEWTRCLSPDGGFFLSKTRHSQSAANQQVRFSKLLLWDW